MNLNLLRYCRLPLFVAVLSVNFNLCMSQTGSTTITEWQYGKNGAISITYDDASRSQFTRALPVMERLKNTCHVLCHHRSDHRLVIPR
ncbi:MAG: hypothetical protein WDM78_15670 [Puia sp.]